MKHYQTIIIGAGAAGIGFGSAMQRLGLTNFLIIEKGHIGESFLRWPRTTQFITPSFTTNLKKNIFLEWNMHATYN